MIFFMGKVAILNLMFPTAQFTKCYLLNGSEHCTFIGVCNFSFAYILISLRARLCPDSSQRFLSRATRIAPNIYLEIEGTQKRKQKKDWRKK